MEIPIRQYVLVGSLVFGAFNAKLYHFISIHDAFTWFVYVIRSLKQYGICNTRDIEQRNEEPKPICET